MQDQTTAIAITNDYPEDKFNSLIPVKTMQELSPLHKIQFNQVQISPKIADGDVYKQGSGLALTKKALMKLMTAANIQVVESISVTPNVCIKCRDIAMATKIAPRCGDCPSKNDASYRVTVAVPDPSGAPRYFQGSKNLRYEEATSVTEKKFLNEQCESKALNRALRGAMMIKSVYTAAELQKPFVVALITLNMANEDLRKVMVAKYAESSTMLWGSAPNRKSLNAPIPEDEITVVPEDDEFDENGTPTVEAEIVENDKPEDDEQADIACEKCGQVIEAFNEEWPATRLIDHSKKHFNGHILCVDCQHEVSEAAKVKKGKGANK